MTNSKIKDMAIISVFTALTAVFSQISVPLPFTPVPINLAVLAVLLAGGLLGFKKAIASQAVYLLLGLVGVPVFAGFSGGLQKLVGPTGGYLIGYLFIAFFAGLIPYLKSDNFVKRATLMTLGIITCYALGTIWFMLSTGTGLIPSLGMCVIPFIPGDLFKLVVGVVFVERLSKVLGQLGFNAR